MKKLLIGCGVVAVLGIVVVAVAGYFIFRTVKGTMETGKRISVAYADTNARFPHDPSAGDAITGPQLDRWLAVRRALLPSIASFKSQLESKTGKNPFTAFSKLMEQSSQFVDAHVAALMEQKMSATEYFWVAHRVISALQSGDALKDPELKELAAAIESIEHKMNDSNRGRQGSQVTVPMTSEAIAATLDQIKQRKQQMLETADVAMVDLILMPIVEAFMQAQTRGRAQPTDPQPTAETEQLQETPLPATP